MFAGPPQTKVLPVMPRRVNLWRGCDAAVAIKIKKKIKALFPMSLVQKHIFPKDSGFLDQTEVDAKTLLLKFCKVKFAHGRFLIPLPVNDVFQD